MRLSVVVSHLLVLGGFVQALAIPKAVGSVSVRETSDADDEVAGGWQDWGIESVPDVGVKIRAVKNAGGLRSENY
ncbi:hypothetical protein MMC26_005951 [Xylographa opegraphella]|nr:hypothetical protein [Xylographa opegraphella]